MAEGAFALPDGQPFDAHGGVTGYSMHTLRVIFVEMEVDEALGRAGIRRCVAGYSAGHIVNPARRARRRWLCGSPTSGFAACQSAPAQSLAGLLREISYEKSLHGTAKRRNGRPASR